MKTSTVKKNIVANFAGKAWVNLMSLVFIPLYIKIMGIEAYGLIGIFVSLIAIFSILDMGLSSTLSRELARLSVSEDRSQESRDLVRTLELVYWGIGIIIGLGFAALSPLIAHYWLNSQGIPAHTVQQALLIMGLVVAFQWPASLYDGGLMGLQQQVLLNSVRGIMATIQHGGAVLALWFISPSILTFFTWQIFTSIAQTFLLSRSVWRSLPKTSQKSVFRTSLLKKNWQFAAGMTSISIMAIILTQADKIILSKLLTLTIFGYYMLAFNLANAVGQLVNPVFSALFPKFAQLIIKQDDEVIISNFYHQGCQLVSILVLPVACVIAFFSEQILFLWVHDSIIAQNAHSLLSLLVIGSALNALMTLPLTIQLAYGWTSLSFLKNVIATIILIPLMIWMVNLYGALGAAIVWIILNAGYFLIEIPVMHRRLLKHEMWRWYSQDIGAPLITILSITFCSRLLMPQIGSPLSSLIWILLTGLLALLFSTLTIPFTREWYKRSIAI